MQCPSWAEVEYFVYFLNRQLKSCEESVYCKNDIIRDTLAGFKTFVLKFMMQMSRVSSDFKLVLLDISFCSSSCCYRTLQRHPLKEK